jgi:ribosome-binding factor A
MATKRRQKSRPVQIAEQVRQSISTMLSDGSIKDPRLHLGTAMVTITDVEMTSDLKLARVFLSVFPEDEKVIKDILKGLRSASSEIKRELHDRLGLRYTPQLEFHFDASVATGARIETILREISDEATEPDDPDRE